jgi:hypothetical protein
MNPQSPPRPRASSAAAAIAVTAAALLAAACGSSPSSTGSGGSTGTGQAASYTSALAYSQCVRAHGIPDFPDPDSSGEIPKAAIVQLKVSGSLLSAATSACEQLNPNQPPSQNQQQQQLTDDLKFAQCMRSHGLPDFPDPTDSNGRVEFVIRTPPPRSRSR